MNLKNIGSNIKRIRATKSLTQNQLAEKANISTVHMSHIETGSVAMSLDTLINIANALGTTPDSLLFGEYKLPDNYADSIFEKLTSDETRLIVEISKLLETLHINKE